MTNVEELCDILMIRDGSVVQACPKRFGIAMARLASLSPNDFSKEELGSATRDQGQHDQARDLEADLG